MVFRRRAVAVAVGALLALLGPAFLAPRTPRLRSRGQTPRTLRNAGVSSSGLALWLLENGAELNPRASVREDEVGRGIWSSGALDLGAEVAKIPWRLLLTKATAMRSLGLSPRLAKEVGEYPCIALQLIHEKYLLKEESFWHSYLELLPETEEIGASFTWNDDDLELLSGSLIKNMSKFLREKISEEYQSITQKVFAQNPERFPQDVFTLPRFLWAYAVLLSRSFRLRLDGKDEVIALVPWIDFMNHDPDSKAYVAATRDGNGPAVLLKTDRPYQGDEQIFDSYGRRSNDELLLLYGFSLTRNVHNFVEISLVDLWAKSDLAQAKKTWLKAQGADVDEMQSLCLPRGYWPQETMLLMRLLLLTPRDLNRRDANLLQSFSDLGMKNAFSPSVERRALRTLRQLCEELLQRCPEERRQSDARIMAEPELLQRLPTKEKCAIMTRYGEVNVLETNVRRIDRLLDHIPFVFDKKEARRQQIFPGLAEDSKPADFDIFLKEFAFDD